MHLCRSGSVVFALFTLIGAAACASSPVEGGPKDPSEAQDARENKDATGVAGESPEQTAEQRAQRDAQHAWCSYLDSLYQRAEPPPGQSSQAPRGPWNRLSQCMSAHTSAAPAMLQQTADCSMHALKGYQGDPFTPDYAREVSRCGTQTLDLLTLSAGQLMPYETALCTRSRACGGDYGECQRKVSINLGKRLRRAMGALNAEGRAEFTACLETSPCGELDAQVSECLAPLMDRLLWLPE